VTGKDILICPDTHGHYKRKGEWEDWDPQETIQENKTNAVQLDYSRNKKKDFTWDTLRRLRRHSSHSRSLYQLNKVHQNNDITGSIGYLPQLPTISDEVSEANTNRASECWDEGSYLVNGRNDEKYKSSPNLCQSNSSEGCFKSNEFKRPHSWLESNKVPLSELEEENELQSTQSVLKFTRWERNNSLITLEIDSPGSNYPELSEEAEEQGGMTCDNRPWGFSDTSYTSTLFSTPHNKNKECHSMESSHSTQLNEKVLSGWSFPPENCVRKRESKIGTIVESDVWGQREIPFESDDSAGNMYDEESDDNTDNNANSFNYDSDSGISSLYECISKLDTVMGNAKSEKIELANYVQPHETEEAHYDSLLLQQAQSLSENESDFMKSLLDLLNVDRPLHHLFLRLADVYKSETFGPSVSLLCCELLPPQLFTYDIDLTTQQISKNLPQILLAVKSRICATQDLVTSRLGQLQMQLTQHNEFFSHLVQTLNLNPIVKVTEVKVLRTFLSQVDILVNLIFGLEMRISGIESQIGQWEYSDYTLENLKRSLAHQLKEAKELLAGHSEKRELVLGMLRDCSDLDTVHLFMQHLRDKEVLLCATRALNYQLFTFKMQLKVLEIT